MDFCQVEQFDFKNRPIKHAKYTKKYVAAQNKCLPQTFSGGMMVYGGV